MKRTLNFSTAVLAGWLGWTSVTQAQVIIRAPFVRIAVGDGVSIKAPFVRINTGEFGYGPYYGPPVAGQPMPPALDVFQPPVPQKLPRVPQAKEDIAPPLPLQPVDALTLEQFAKSFKPKAGFYEVTMLNPVTKRPTNVRFTLPEGTPNRILTNRNSIEFVYGLRQYVRIEFDKDGAIITSR